MTHYDIQPGDYDEMEAGREQPALLSETDLDDDTVRIEEPDPLLVTHHGEDIDEADRRTPNDRASFFVFSRLPTSPLDWRLTLVYSYLCYRTRYGRGASLREIQAATGISRTTLTTLKGGGDGGDRRKGLMAKLLDAGLVNVVNRQYFALEPPSDVAKGLFYERSGEVKHWTDRWAYFTFSIPPGWSGAVALVYAKLKSLGTISYTERGLAKLLGMSRDAVGTALRTLELVGKVATHLVPDENRSFFLLVPDLDRILEEMSEPEGKQDDGKEGAQVEEAKAIKKPKQPDYERFVEWCGSKQFPDYLASKIYPYVQRLGHKRFNEILDECSTEHERKKKLDPEKYYGTCHALLLHRLSKAVGE